MTRRWERGTQILHRFLMHGEAVDARPVTVVADDEDALVLWLAHGTPTRVAQLPGGIDLRSVSKREMFGQRWQTGPREWSNNVLMTLPHGAPYAIWSFFAPDGTFTRWYANLQSPYERWSGGIDIVDHQLDLVGHARPRRGLEGRGRAGGRARSRLVHRGRVRAHLRRGAPARRTGRGRQGAVRRSLAGPATRPGLARTYAAATLVRYGLSGLTGLRPPAVCPEAPKVRFGFDLTERRCPARRPSAAVRLRPPRGSAGHGRGVAP